MTDSSQDPERPKPSPPAYLPRIKYQEPQPEPEADTDYALADGPEPPIDPARKLKKKQVESSLDLPSSPRPKPAKKSSETPLASPKKKKSPIDDDAAKAKTGVLIEQTPELDTYESRKRVRLIVGGVAGGLIVLTLFLIVRAFRSTEPSDEELVSQQPFVYSGTGKSAPAANALESQAKQLLDDAEQYEKRGKMDQAIARLGKIAKDYPKTASAKKAAECLERHEQGLPLFPGGPAVIAKKTETKPPEPEPEPEKSAEILVVSPKPPATSGPVVVNLAPPPFPPEPRRETGVSLNRADVPAKPLPDGFRARPEAGVHASGWPLEITCDKDGSAMMLVPGDTFTQGRDDGQAESKPAHKVRLSSYYIDQHEITVRQFLVYQGKPPSDDRRAKVDVSLTEAKAYAEWAGKSIPTEAQWEMAARSIDARTHPWGNQPPSWKARPPKQIDPVMNLPDDLSPYGVYDLAGNAWEWTSDWFETKYYQQFKGTVPVNPSGPAKGKSRLPEIVVKGGSKDCDASWRSGMRPNAKLPYLGFRCVLNVEAPPAPPSSPAPPSTPNPPGPPTGGGIPF